MHLFLLRVPWFLPASIPIESSLVPTCIYSNWREYLGYYYLHLSLLERVPWFLPSSIPIGESSLVPTFIYRYLRGLRESYLHLSLLEREFPGSYLHLSRLERVSGVEYPPLNPAPSARISSKKKNLTIHFFQFIFSLLRE